MPSLDASLSRFILKNTSNDERDVSFIWSTQHFSPFNLQIRLHFMRCVTSEGLLSQTKVRRSASVSGKGRERGKKGGGGGGVLLL